MPRATFVKRGLAYFASAIIGGALTLAGQVMFSGDNIYIPEQTVSSSTARLVVKDYTSSASSQVAASFSPPTSRERILTGARLSMASSSFTATTAQRVTISLTTSANATGTGSEVLFDGFVSIPTAGFNLTPSSTVDTLYASSSAGVAPHLGELLSGPVVWDTSHYLNILFASPTGTLVGKVYAEFDQ